MQEPGIAVEVDSLNNLYSFYPEFIDYTNNNFMLMPNSPCINNGILDTTGLSLPVFDILGNPRIVYDTIDIGAFEFKNCESVDTNNIIQII